MQRYLLVVGLLATTGACSSAVCAEAEDIQASCLSGTAAPSDAECPSGSQEACEAQCIVDRSAEYCEIERETADEEVIAGFDECIAACADLATETPEKPKTEET